MHRRMVREESGDHAGSRYLAQAPLDEKDIGEANHLQP